MDLTRALILLFTGYWVILCLFAIVYGVFVMRDAQKDVEARTAAKINSGREALARLLVATSKLYVFGFVFFLLGSLYVVSPLSRIPGWWRGLVLPLLFDIGLTALTVMMVYKHRVRRGVLVHDMEAETARILAAATLVSNDMKANTAAQREVAEAVRAMTHELGNGPLAASLAQTAAVDRLSVAVDANTSSHNTEVGANTAGLEANTVATELNTEARIGNGGEG